MNEILDLVEKWPNNRRENFNQRVAIRMESGMSENQAVLLTFQEYATRQERAMFKL